jgi:hypothetical protein
VVITEIEVVVVVVVATTMTGAIGIGTGIVVAIETETGGGDLVPGRDHDRGPGIGTGGDVLALGRVIAIEEGEEEVEEACRVC